MGFLDKAKEAAAQATVKAQQGLAQGQAKVVEMQAKRQADAVLRDLGAAYYARQRSGGSAEAVDEALSAVDSYVEANGPLDATVSAAPPSPPSPPAQPGGYGLDDL